MINLIPDALQFNKLSFCFVSFVRLQFCPAGDLIFEVYLEKREPEQCLLIKVRMKYPLSARSGGWAER